MRSLLLHLPTIRFEYYGVEVLAAFVLLGLFALLLLRRLGLLDSRRALLVSVLLLFIALDIRWHILCRLSFDYNYFLSEWVAHYRDNGGFAAFSTVYETCNYHVLYLYFLTGMSYLPVNDLYLIKLFSIVFDLVLAYAAARLLGCLGVKQRTRMRCFFLVLFLPSVILNSSYWAQCDSIYVSLAILGIALGLEDRPVRSMLCITLSFCFKLQAVFLMPVYALLWMHGKLKLRHLLLFPVFYVAVLTPAVLMGRPLVDTLLFYLTHLTSAGTGLNAFSASVFALLSVPPEREAFAAKLAIGIAFLLVCAVLLLCLCRRRRITDRTIVLAAVLFSVLIPFCLPYMHDRYFYAADVLLLAMALYWRPALPTPVFSQLSSCNVYCHALWDRLLFPVFVGSLLQIPGLLLSAAAFLRSFRPPAPDRG